MVGVSRVGGDRGNMNDSECECSVCNIFWERVSQGYHGGDFFVNKLLIEEKWDTDKRGCNKSVLLSVAVDAVAI